MSRQTFFINGRDSYDFGFRVTRMPKLLASYPTTVPALRMAGRAGEGRASGGAFPEARDFTVEGYFTATTNALLIANLRAFWTWCPVGVTHEISTAWASGLVLFATLVAPGFDPLDPQLLSETATGALQFRLHSPFWYDRYPLWYCDAANKEIMPQLGNWPSAPVIRVVNGAINANISLYSGAGVLRKTIQHDGTHTGSGDYTEQDSDSYALITSTGTVRASTPNLVSNVSDPFILLDPYDGDPFNGRFPYLVSDTAIEVGVRRVWTI